MDGFPLVQCNASAMETTQYYNSLGTLVISLFLTADTDSV